MKRSGLQKNIAFIFDGEESVTDSPQVTSAAPAVQVMEPAPIANRQIIDNGLYAPAISQTSARRPQPVPQKSSAGDSIISPSQAIKLVKSRLKTKKSAGSSNHQKKMAILVAVLAVVFVGVLVFVLGSSPANATAAASSTDSQTTHSALQVKGVNSWKKPEAYPAQLRDPMTWSSQKQTGSADTGGDSTLVVRGIVYSEINPTAIISGHIVRQGEMVADVKVVKIAKDYVEFEKDNKQWKQQVER